MHLLPFPKNISIKIINLIHWLKPIGLVLFSTFATFTLISRIGIYFPTGSTSFDWLGDHSFYILMAESIQDSNIAPYCWRIAVPFLSSLFPSTMIGFLSIAIISFIFSGVSVYLLAEAFGFNKVLSIFGVLLFYSIEGIQYALYNFWLPDALTITIIVISILAIHYKKDLFLIIILMIGVTVKESILFVIPLYYSLNAKKIIDLQLLKRTFIIGFPAVLVLITIRFLIVNDNGSYNYLMLLNQMLPNHIHNFSINEYLIKSFGLTAFLPFLSIKKNKELFIQFSPFILLVFSQLLFATDTFRLLAFCFPATILMSLNSLDCKK